MPSNRKFFVGGNWKMNGDKASIDVICKFLTQVNKITRNYFGLKSYSPQPQNLNEYFLV